MLVRSLLNRSKILVNRAVGRRFSSTVMSFGDGSHGALGLPSSVAGLGIDAFEPTRVGSIPSEILAIGAGHYHSLAVTSDGHLWAWGRDLEAQLGRGFSSPRDSWNEPRRVIGLDRVRVKAAFGSGVVSAAIGDDGSLWTWGKSKRGQLGLGKEVVEAVLPSKVEALSGEKITKVSFGWGHALAQTDDGKLFGWGYSADGRLGNIGGTLESSPLESNSVGNLRDLSSSTLEAAQKLVSEAMEKENNMPIVWEPRRVTEIDGSVVDISCGLDHSLILSGNGVLLSCGSNVYSQLGRSQQDLGIFPVDTSFRPTSIASGLGHALAIAEVDCDSKSGPDNTVITWGWNQTFQLGRAGPESVPSKLEGLETETPVSVCGGRAHSAALTAAGELWVWGCGKNGRLGLGSSIDEPEPAFLDSLEGRRVLQVVAGFDHSLVLVDGE